MGMVVCEGKACEEILGVGAIYGGGPMRSGIEFGLEGKEFR